MITKPVVYTPAEAAEAYIIQSDPFFAGLREWGDTIWQLWKHNMEMPGAAPILMTRASIEAGGEGESEGEGEGEANPVCGISVINRNAASRARLGGVRDRLLNAGAAQSIPARLYYGGSQGR